MTRTFDVAMAVILVVGSVSAAPAEPAWSGGGKIRLIVEVAPVDLKDRKSDTLVASFPIDFDQMLAERGARGSADLSTLQVHQLDASGKPVSFPKFDGSRSEYDRPARFDDDALPEKFPASVVRAAQTKDGRSDVVIRDRKARLFNREVLPKTGKLVWTHTQSGSAPTRYAIYVDVKPTESSKAWQVSPAPWVGDADVLRRPTGPSLGGWSHFTATAGDFDGDGLFDIVAGTEKGNLVWFPNHGKPGEPRFLGCRVLTDEHGPLDTGWYGAPFLFDWDNDGLTDLIVGTSGNVILWWKNVGTKTEPKLSFRSFVTTGDKRLEVPEGPVAEDYGRKKTFGRDYYNQPWVGDFTGDGVPDIVTGGYTTGIIWLFKGTGRDENGVPNLEYVGPVEADGKPIDTTWAAAPSVADFDGDGKLDLVTGSWWWSGIHHDPAPGQIEYLMYYKGGGDATKPTLARAPFPRDGEFAKGQIARPSLVDWNNDGLIDLMVSAGSDVCVYLNVGSAAQPQWKTSEHRLTIPWGFTDAVDLVADSGDVTGDGRPEFLTGQTFFSVRGSPHSPEIVNLGRATVGGKPIEHSGPGYGDHYYATSLRDWDADGKADLLWGTHQGNVFLHRSIGTKQKPFEFAEGVMLKTLDGQPIKVGPPVVASKEEASDFTIMQGSRIRVLSDDFDSDKIDDLIVTETYGNVWLYRNTKQGGTDTLEAPVLLQKLSSRTSFVGVDWNQDGKTDLFSQGPAAAPGAIMMNETKDGKPALSKPSRPFELPYLFWGTQFGATDWNRDGDRDLMVTAEFFTFFIEQSFLTHGYREAKLVSSGTRPATTRANAIRVACCGDSITRRPVGAAYSHHLGTMLGDGWDVRNFGHDGVTAQKDSGRPFGDMPEFEAANVFEPNVVILMLGTNDAASTDEGRKNFARDFLALVRHFQSLPSKPQVIVMTPPPLMPGREDSRMNNLKNDLSPHVRRIAKEEGLVLVELQEEPALADPALYPDKVHPNGEGAKIIAERIRDVMRARR